MLLLLGPFLPGGSGPDSKSPTWPHNQKETLCGVRDLLMSKSPLFTSPLYEATSITHFANVSLKSSPPFKEPDLGSGAQESKSKAGQEQEQKQEQEQEPEQESNIPPKQMDDGLGLKAHTLRLATRIGELGRALHV